MTDTASTPITDLWLGLPEELKAKLRLGFTGKLHLLDIAGWCLRHGGSALQPIAADAILTAFGENPLDGEMVAELLSHDPVRAMLPADAVSAMTAVARKWRKPDNLDYFFRLLEKRDFGKLKHYVEQSAERFPETLFWREQALAFGLMDNDPDWTEQMLDIGDADGLEPVLANIKAQVAAMRDQCGHASRLAITADKTFGKSFSAMRSGMCMRDSEDQAAGRAMLLPAVARAPWNMNLLLRVHDLLTGIHAKTVELPGSVAVLLYSWNKAEELDATLASLLRSDLSGASVFVLDNGSTDSTPDVLASWQTQFDAELGAGRFTVVSLPTNIGAPPARNWLMHMDAVRQHDFVCYLDDDVELPADWLGRFGAAVRAYPDAGVWGCKVVDHANPALVQSADAHLLVDPGGGPMQLEKVAPNPFKLSDLHIQSLDTGLMDFLRPCASVTGCCHLFRTEQLHASGDFAIHLSPSQYDDMEHDIRLCIDGKFPVYQGHLAVRHKKRTGAASRLSAQEEGNALGNKYKMQTMHSRESLASAMRAEQALLEKDLLNKIGVVEKALVG